MPRKPKTADADIIVSDKKSYKCLCCGKEYDSPIGHFYKNSYGNWKANDNYTPICKECVTEMFEKYSRMYESDRTACLILCHILDIPFYNSLYDSIVQSSGTCTPGKMSRIVLNQRQFQMQTFSNTLTNGELNKNALDVRDEKEQKWSKAEIQARDDVVSVVGYV